MKHRSKNFRRGQTLVEALVALSLLTTGFVGIASLLTRSFELNRTTSEDTQATYLASEGIEIAKSLIDHDVYEQSGGNIGYSWGSCFHYSGSYYYYPIDYETTGGSVPGCGTLTVSNAPNNNPLYVNPNTDLYSYDSSGIKTDFVRNIKVTNNGNEIDVKSIVTWSAGVESNTITLEDQFYNWQPGND